MAVLEWKTLNFFHSSGNIDDGKLFRTIKGEITCYASGLGQNILCNELGTIYIFYRNWDYIAFNGHDSPIVLCALSLQTNSLLTVESKKNISCFKIWNLSKADKRKGVPCAKTTSCNFQEPTAIAISEAIGTLFAIGFKSGDLSLYKGDLNRNIVNIKQFSIGSQPITEVYIFALQENEKELRIFLDRTNSPARCCALHVKNKDETYFMLGRDDAVICYTLDGLGPCYALEGKKKILSSFGNYLLIVIETLNNQDTSKNVLIIIDIHNKFIVYNTTIETVVAVFTEYSAYRIVTKDKQVHHIYEKDLKSKIVTLFKRNLYDIAIRMLNEHCNMEELASVYKQYADHIYNKGDFQGAMEKYKKTVRYVESSHVIKKFLDTRHIDLLGDYLLSIYIAGKNTRDHDSLQLKIKNRIDLPNKLEKIISAGSGDQPHLNLDIYLENISSTLEHSLVRKEDLQTFFKKNVFVLLDQCPKEVSNFFKKIITFHIDPGKEDVTLLCNTQYRRINSIFCIPFFFKHTEELRGFLEIAIKNIDECSEEIYSTLVENHLRKSTSKDRTTKTCVLEVMKSYKKLYDVDMMLIICAILKCSQGIMLIFEDENNLNYSIRYFIKEKKFDGLNVYCVNNGKYQPYLWVLAFHCLPHDESSKSVLLNILNEISIQKLQSPLQILNSLTINEGPTIGYVRDYYIHHFQRDLELTAEDIKQVEVIRNEKIALQKLLTSFAYSPMQFKNTACSSCHQSLAISSVYFLCQHSFHLDCLKNFNDNERRCNICSQLNTKIKDTLKNSQDEQHHESFHSLLERSDDAFSIMSGFFGRCVFNKIIVFEELNKSERHNLNVKENQTNVISSRCSIWNTISKNPFDVPSEYDESKNPFGMCDTLISEDSYTVSIEQYDNNLNPF